MNYNSGRLLLFPKVNEAKINEQKTEKASKLKIKIECEMKRNKTTSLYNLYDKNKSEVTIENSKLKSPTSLFKHSKHPSILNQFQMQSFDHQKIWKLINKNLLLRQYQHGRKKLYKTDEESIREEEEINDSNLLYRRSIEIVRGRDKLKRRFITQQKAQQNFNPERQKKKIMDFFNIKGINKNIEQHVSLSPKLENIKQLRTKIKKQSRKNLLSKGNKSKRKVQSKLMSLNGWKTEQDQLILFD